MWIFGVFTAIAVLLTASDYIIFGKSLSEKLFGIYIR